MSLEQLPTTDLQSSLHSPIFKIGGVAVQLSHNLPWHLETTHDFVLPTNQPSSELWHIQLTDYATLKSQIQKQTPRLLFDSHGSWSAYGPACTDANLPNGSTPCKTKTLTSFVAGDSLMLINDSEKMAFYSWQTSKKFDDNMWGFRFPLDELFFINAFAITKAVLVHSLSIVAHQKGFLFCGVSGAGKSTLGQILENRGYRYLCDERNALCISSHADKKIQLESTPFHGTSEKAHAGRGPLAGILILDPSHKGLSLKPISHAEAMPLIYQTIFLPQYSKQKMELSLDTLEHVIDKTPIFQLNYDKSKVDISEFLEREVFSPLSQL